MIKNVSAWGLSHSNANLDSSVKTMIKENWETDFDCRMLLVRR